jgi:hypothetical protein
MVLGIGRYLRVRRAIEESRKNVGNSSEAFIKAVIGED